MTGKISNVIRIKETAMRAGKYDATWSGYLITIKLDNGEIRMTTEHGVRGFVKGTVHVLNTGEISFAKSP
jgi:hypothetical protein